MNCEAREDSPALEVRREVEGGGFLVVLLETGVFSNSSIAAAKTSIRTKSMNQLQRSRFPEGRQPVRSQNRRLTERLVPKIKPIIHHLKLVLIFLPTPTRPRTFTDIYLEIIIITPFPLFGFLLLGLPLGSGSSCYGLRRIRTCIFGFGIRLRVDDFAFR